MAAFLATTIGYQIIKFVVHLSCICCRNLIRKLLIERNYKQKSNYFDSSSIKPIMYIKYLFSISHFEIFFSNWNNRPELSLFLISPNDNSELSLFLILEAQLLNFLLFWKKIQMIIFNCQQIFKLTIFYLVLL